MVEIRFFKPGYRCPGCVAEYAVFSNQVTQAADGSWVCDNQHVAAEDDLVNGSSVSSAPDTLPCPFCNSTEQGVEKGPDRTVSGLICHGCGAKGPPLIVSVSDEQLGLVMAVRNWNRREGVAGINNPKE